MATIFGTDIFYAQMRGIQAGEKCYVNLFYYYPTPPATPSCPIDLKNQLEAGFLPAIAALQTTSFTWDQIVIDRRGPNPTGPQTYAVNVPGTVVGDCLSPLNTFSFRKIPDNPEIDPPASEIFTTGRISVSGIPESSQENGIVTAALIPSLTAAVQGLLSYSFVDCNGNPVTMDMFMNRIDPLAPAAVPVSDVLYNRIGTQLTRKF